MKSCVTKIESYILPASWASYLVNGDASGLDDKEEAEISAWIESRQPGGCVGCSDEPEFRHRNDSGNHLAGDCLTFDFLK